MAQFGLTSIVKKPRLEQTLLCLDKGQKIMCRERRHDWDTPDDIEDGHLDEESSSSDEMSNAVRYVITSSGSPVIFLSFTEKRKALDIENPVLSSPSGKILVYRKAQDRKRTNPFIENLKKRQ